MSDGKDPFSGKQRSFTITTYEGGYLISDGSRKYIAITEDEVLDIIRDQLPSFVEIAKPEPEESEDAAG